jgi:hypothetical protein
MELVSMWSLGVSPRQTHFLFHSAPNFILHFVICTEYRKVACNVEVVSVDLSVCFISEAI